VGLLHSASADNPLLLAAEDPFVEQAPPPLARPRDGASEREYATVETHIVEGRSRRPLLALIAALDPA